MTFTLTPITDKWLRENTERLDAPMECHSTHQRPAWVYTLLSDEGFLYVGYTTNLAKRLASHTSTKPWWNYVDKITADLMCCDHHARQAEAYTIGLRRPVYNSLFPEHGRFFAHDWVRLGFVSIDCDEF